MTYRAHLPLVLGLGLCLPNLAACSVDADGDDGVNASLTEGDGDGDGDDWSDAGDGDGDPGGTTSGAGDEGGDPGGDGGDGGDSGDGDGDPDPEPGQLTAGEWRDLDHWDFWLALGGEESDWLQKFDLWGFDTRVRVPVFAIANDQPVADVPVELLDANDDVLWRARTNNDGQAELWPALTGPDPAWPLTIVSGDVSVEVEEIRETYEQFVLELPAQNPVVDLDLMFVVDTTGSMADELNYLQAELEDVIQRVDADLPGDFELRLSVNFYRDHGDEYVVRSFPFTTDVELAVSQIAAQEADGGGDFPEAVEAALTDAVFEHQWSDSARARLMFLILDAPPHDTQQNLLAIEASIREAARRGIRVIPVAASGADKDTEFLLRDIDIATGATYTFLTDHSGIGGGHLEPTIGEYDVESFNDLLVRLIVEAML